MRVVVLAASFLIACSQSEPGASAVGTELTECRASSGRYVMHWEQRPGPVRPAVHRCGSVNDIWIDNDDDTPTGCKVDLVRDDSSCTVTGTVLCGEVTSRIDCEWDKEARGARCSWRTTTSYCDETYDVTYRRPLWADFLAPDARR